MPLRGWEDDVKMDLKQVACQPVYQIQEAKVLDRRRSVLRSVIGLGMETRETCVGSSRTPFWLGSDSN